MPGHNLLVTVCYLQINNSHLHGGAQLNNDIRFKAKFEYHTGKWGQSQSVTATAAVATAATAAAATAAAGVAAGLADATLAVVVDRKSFGCAAK